MMRLLLLLLFLIPLTSHAQLNYISYHRQIIQAENYMLALDYKACVKTYKETFRAYPKTFARDAFAALQIACIVKDTAGISYFFERCVSNGITWEVMKASKNFRDVMAADHQLQKRLDVLYSISHKKYERSIDTNTRWFVRRLLIKDGEARFNKQGEVKDSADIVNWLQVLERNVYQLDSLVKRLGYPGERMVGALIKDVSINNGKPTGVYICSEPSRIFFHNQCGFQLMKNELQKAVQEGELMPKEYALIQEWSFQDFEKSKRWWDKYYCAPCIPGPHDKRYNFFLNSDRYIDDIAFVDQCRNEIGMCSVFHEKKLKSFGKEHELILQFGFLGGF